jgi:hypothetical protein
MPFFVRSPFGRDKRNIPSAHYMANLAQRLNRLNVKDYFDKLKEVASNAIRYH